MVLTAKQQKALSSAPKPRRDAMRKAFERQNKQPKSGGSKPKGGRQSAPRSQRRAPPAPRPPPRLAGAKAVTTRVLATVAVGSNSDPSAPLSGYGGIYVFQPGRPNDTHMWSLDTGVTEYWTKWDTHYVWQRAEQFPSLAVDAQRGLCTGATVEVEYDGAPLYAKGAVYSIMLPSLPYKKDNGHGGTNIHDLVATVLGSPKCRMSTLSVKRKFRFNMTPVASYAGDPLDIEDTGTWSPAPHRNSESDRINDKTGMPTLVVLVQGVDPSATFVVRMVERWRCLPHSNSIWANGS